MERFIQCKCVLTKNKELIPVWELNARVDDEDDIVIDNNLFSNVILESDDEVFDCTAHIVDSYYDLVTKKVVIGKLIEIVLENYNPFKVGEKVLVEEEHNNKNMILKTIESIEVNKNKCSCYFLKKEEKDIKYKWLKGGTVIREESFSDNIDLIEIKAYSDFIYKFTDGTSETYEFKLKRLITNE